MTLPPPSEHLEPNSRGHPQRERPKTKKTPKPQRQKAKNVKRGLLLDEISNSLINQLYAHQSNPCECYGSLFDRLRSVNSITSVRSGSSSSSRTLVNNSTSSDVSSCKTGTVTASRPDHHLRTHVKQPTPVKPKYRQHESIVTLDDFATMDTIKRLAADYGRINHMGVLDRSYSFFMNKAGSAALSFKVENKVAVVQGDPLCDPVFIPSLLAEFEEYRKQFSWGIAFMGASGAIVDYAKEHKWTTMEFGRERVLNTMTNDVLLERSGKRIIVQNRQLLDPRKGGVTLGLYVPSHDNDLELQKKLVSIYDAWRRERNRTSAVQAFITVYDPFSLPDLMTYIYTRGPDGVPNGFAALRKIGANQGYHIDPCIAAPEAPRGVSDLLIFTAMALLNRAGVSYLSFGYEPVDDLREVTGMPRPFEKATRAIHRYTFPRLPLGGKKAYHDKFKPDESLGSSLHVIFPASIPSPRQVMAMAHMANVSLRKLVSTDDRTFPKSSTGKRQKNSDKDALENIEKAPTLEDRLRRLNWSSVSTLPTDR